MRCLVVLLLVGCGRPTFETAADGCYYLASAACDRLNECGALSVTVGQCRAVETGGCCAGKQCALPVGHCVTGNTCCIDSVCTAMRVNEESFFKCEPGIRKLSCGQITGGLLPIACVFPDGGS